MSQAMVTLPSPQIASKSCTGCTWSCAELSQEVAVHFLCVHGLSTQHHKIRLYLIHCVT